MNATPEITVLVDPDALAEEAARRFVSEARDSVARHGTFAVALSGGSTPKAMYAKLAASSLRDDVDWSRIQVFFSDERFVPPDSPESNYHTAREGLLTRVPIPERFIHPVPTVAVSPEESAAMYEETVRRVVEAGDDGLPRFDLILLGLGPDGHTASLFPDTPALSITDRLVAPNFVPKFDSWRITFTYPCIDAARMVTFLVQGEDKAEPVREILTGAVDLPGARVRPTSGRLTWLLDGAAASRHEVAPQDSA